MDAHLQRVRTGQGGLVVLEGESGGGKTRLIVEIAKRGYRTSEPNEMARESSQILNKVFNALRDEGVTKNTIAKDLCLSPKEIEALVFSLAVVGVRGSKIVQLHPRASERPKLRLVQSGGKE